VEKERQKRRGPLTRRFIVTEGIFEKDGRMVDLPKLIELKLKYKYRLVLDESFSFGTVGRTGRGLTELYNVPASQVDMLIGSIANGLASCGGFCAGSQVVVDHQRINGTSFVFSASMPALLTVSASEGISILRNQPSILAMLQENIRAVHSVLASIVGQLVLVPSHPASPIIHITIKPQSATYLSPTTVPLSAPNSTSSKSSSTKSNPASIVPSPLSPSFSPAEQTFDADTEEKILQEIVEECLALGVWVTRAKRLKGQEMVERKPSIRLAISAALTRKEVEKAAGVVKGACVKVLGKKR